MSLPDPEPGLVIRYSYLWLREHAEGREDGLKDRPCAIVLSRRNSGGANRVVVLPITHRPPADNATSLEIPTAIKQLLGLDAERSWVMLSESNLFDWPGPDLRPFEKRGERSFAYGYLPPRFFNELLRRFVLLESALRSERVPRT